MKIKLSNVNHARRHGLYCANCNILLGKNRLDGQINNKSVSFCCFNCHDEYINKQKGMTNENN